MKTNIEMKQTANDNQYIRVWELLTRRKAPHTIIVLSPWGYRRMTVRCPYDFMGPASCGDLAGSLRLSQESTMIFWPK